MSIVHTKDYILVVAFWSFIADKSVWCILSSKKNPILYARILIITITLALLHRLYFGLDQAGTWFYNIVGVTASIPFIYYAVTGKIPQWALNFAVDKEEVKEGDNVIKYQRSGNV